MQETEVGTQQSSIVSFSMILGRLPKFQCRVFRRTTTIPRSEIVKSEERLLEQGIPLKLIVYGILDAKLYTFDVGN